MQTKNLFDTREIRKKVHHLKPVVIIGANGLTAAVLSEINIALDAHELVKVRINGVDRVARNATTQEICKQTEALLIQTIGNVIAIYRKQSKG